MLTYAVLCITCLVLPMVLSNLAAGACVAEINHSLALRIYDECEGPGEHVYLNCPYIRIAADEIKCSLAAALLVPLK